jgi:hypothetical protein
MHMLREDMEKKVKGSLGVEAAMLTRIGLRFNHLLS